VCGSCHTRRGELTGRFRPGDAYLDHFDPVLPSGTGVFYADGQVREEDFEFVPFMLSYMHEQGIRCTTCHNSHTGNIRDDGNELCLQCHREGVTDKIKIEDPTAHSHHAADNTGNLCVNCHMPQTVYMQRHWRRDHGMTIPDPLLTREFGIPNACNRCHTDQTTDWAVEYATEWYGDRLNRPTRRRTRLLARIEQGDDSAVPALLQLLHTEKREAWRAVYARYLTGVLDRANPPLMRQIVDAMLGLLDDPSPLVQSAAIDALDPIAGQLSDRIAPKLESPTRLVRIKAAWALRRQLDTTSDAARDLFAQIAHNIDQPTGAFQYARYLADRRRDTESLAWFQKAIQWDPGSAPFRYAYAVMLRETGEIDAAIDQLRAATTVDPKSAFYYHALGLLYAEKGDLESARDALREAVRIAPTAARYWYNLALAESKLGEHDAAIEAIGKAEQLEPSNADFAYAHATILLDAGRVEEARRAAERTLTIDPNYTPAIMLLQQNR
jgi:predicted CXXCH cytochrome family protein